MFSLYRIHVAFVFAQKSYHTGFLFTHKNRDFVMISVTKLHWSQKWSITNWIGSMLHFGAVWTSVLSIAQVNKYEKRLEPTETEANYQEWGLGFSSPNPLGQPLLHNVQCVWTTCSSFVLSLFILCKRAFWVGMKSYPAECENGLRPWLTVTGDHIIEWLAIGLFFLMWNATAPTLPWCGLSSYWLFKKGTVPVPQ